MKFRIQHHTRYQYMEKIFLEPHVIRLLPRRDNHVNLISKSVNICPEPIGVNEILENNGTVSLFAWFKGMTNIFDIKTDVLITMDSFNPFDFLVYPSSGLRLPIIYSTDLSAVLTPYFNFNQEDPSIRLFAQNLAESCGQETVPFLINLCRIIYEEFSYEKREKGAPYQPAETLKHKKGSCRDFTVFAMAVCREMGFACRYVSGYYVSENPDEPGELHAWMEVFLPGAGWKGFDPSHGIACDHHHIALSASADPARTLPVTGSFRGFSSSRMDTDVMIQPVQ
ncbi:MAG: transglutaminase family protein [Sinomicrobium sp.]|nr:transglutaminase family protein [Candidatus Omnitrophota bacterium]MCB0375440.1 transglutaminase family protein [Sinomicrobium sp.]